MFRERRGCQIKECEKKRGQESGVELEKRRKKRNRKGKRRPSTPKRGELYIDEISVGIIYLRICYKLTEEDIEGRKEGFVHRGRKQTEKRGKQSVKKPKCRYRLWLIVNSIFPFSHLPTTHTNHETLIYLKHSFLQPSTAKSSHLHRSIEDQNSQFQFIKRHKLHDEKTTIPAPKGNERETVQNSSRTPQQKPNRKPIHHESTPLLILFSTTVS